MKVRYFALLRERLGRDADEVEPPAEVMTVAGLIDWLRGRDPEPWTGIETLHAAIDDELVPLDTPLGGAVTVAIFPPMTAG